jgi:hypothetical protein
MSRHEATALGSATSAEDAYVSHHGLIRNPGNSARNRVLPK